MIRPGKRQTEHSRPVPALPLLSDRPAEAMAVGAVDDSEGTHLPQGRFTIVPGPESCRDLLIHVVFRLDVPGRRFVEAQRALPAKEPPESGEVLFFTQMNPEQNRIDRLKGSRAEAADLTRSAEQRDHAIFGGLLTIPAEVVREEDPVAEEDSLIALKPTEPDRQVERGDRRADEKERNPELPDAPASNLAVGTDPPCRRRRFGRKLFFTPPADCLIRTLGGADPAAPRALKRFPLHGTGIVEVPAAGTMDLECSGGRGGIFRGIVHAGTRANQAKHAKLKGQTELQGLV